MLLGGLWHGAATRFIIWGGLHGAALAVHKYITGLRFYSQISNQKLFSVIGWLLTFHFVCFCWIFFRAPDLETVSAMLSQIAFSFSGELLPQLISGYTGVMLLMTIGYLLHFLPESSEKWGEQQVTRLPLAGKIVLLTAVIFLVIQTKSAGIQPFIYFQF
jgi:D-alanyl-lipoteichoic acid acyltransferase DltB (MBOAT superfamily)